MTVQSFIAINWDEKKLSIIKIFKFLTTLKFFNFFIIDECLVNNGGCHKYADCINLIGSFECKCKTGFSGNGTFCEGRVWPKLISNSYVT